MEFRRSRNFEADAITPSVRRILLVSSRAMCTLKNPTAPDKPMTFVLRNFFNLKDTLIKQQQKGDYIHNLRSGRKALEFPRYGFGVFCVMVFPPYLIWSKLMGHN